MKILDFRLFSLIWLQTHQKEELPNQSCIDNSEVPKKHFVWVSLGSERKDYIVAYWVIKFTQWCVSRQRKVQIVLNFGNRVFLSIATDTCHKKVGVKYYLIVDHQAIPCEANCSIRHLIHSSKCTTFLGWNIPNFFRHSTPLSRHRCMKSAKTLKLPLKSGKFELFYCNNGICCKTALLCVPNFISL